MGTSPLNFGPYDPTSASDNLPTGYVEVRCTCTFLDCVASSYKIELGVDHGTSTARYMKRTGGTETLNYFVYRDLLRQQNFGSGASGMTVIYLLALMGSYQRTTIYGKMIAKQTARVGDYTDSPGITITY